MGVFKRILDVIKKILIVILIIFILCFGSIVFQKKILKNAIPNLFGYVGGTIMTGSMEPNIKIGDYVIARINDGYDVGDVVMFKYGNNYIAHRVIEVYDDEILTKGDNNKTADVKIKKTDVVGPVVKVISGFGKFISFLVKYKYLIFLIVVLITILL